MSPGEPRSEAPGAAGPTPDTAVLDVSSAWDADAAVENAAAGELPLEVRKDSVRGIGTASAVGGGVLVVYSLAMVVGAPGADAKGSSRRAVAWLITILLLYAGMFWMTRVSRAKPDMVIRLGLVHFVVVSLLFATLRHVHGTSSHEWSPVAVWILLFAALVPLRPGVVLGWSLLAASMEPFALLAARGDATRAAEAAALSASSFLAAAMAFVTSRVVYGLTARVAKAREFGSYRLVQRLGAGGAAEVWRADHRMLARPAAVKLVRPGVLQTYGERESARLVRLFEKEVQATAGLRSPHTIQVYDFGVAADGTFYYVMELLDGFDLQTLVERFGRQPPERVAHVLLQVCHSLHEAHGFDLVHRDVKPGNVYLCRYGADLDFAKVLDFGLVLDRRPTEEELGERRRVQIGTPAVMAPEQIRFDAPVDQRADIYALGCVAYWLLAGARVFEAQSRQDMLVMHAHQRPDPPSRRIKAPIPEGLERLVMQCLEKNPNRRPQTAMEVSEALMALGLAEQWTRTRMDEWWNAARTDGTALQARASSERRS